MDNTIRTILELDASAEQRLQTASQQCESWIEQAKQKAAALDEARHHATADAIFEFEEKERAAAETEINRLQNEYTAESQKLEKQFSGGNDKMLALLFDEVIAQAEA